MLPLPVTFKTMSTMLQVAYDAEIAGSCSITYESATGFIFNQRMFKDYLNIASNNVDDSGLRNLHAGLYKTGAGILRLTGDNTYQGSTVAAGGTLAVDGSVAGDAYSTGSGILAGTGTVTTVTLWLLILLSWEISRGQLLRKIP